MRPQQLQAQFRSIHLQPDGIIDGDGQVLDSTEVALSRLDGGVAEQDLDLLEVAAGLAAELGAGAAQVVRRELAERGLARLVDDHTPDAFCILDRGSGKSSRENRPMFVADVEQKSAYCVSILVAVYSRGSRSMLRSILACISILCAWSICSAQGSELLIRAGELLDVRNGQYVKDQGIFISEGTIREVGPFAKVKASHPAAASIDLSTRYVLPGLIDCHTHLLLSDQPGLPDNINMIMTAAGMSTAERALLGARNARQVHESGITTVRDVGNSGVNGDVALRNAIDHGLVVGPRILASTRALALPGAQFPVAMNPEVATAIWNQEYAIVANVEEARAAVRNAFASGARVIKVIGDGHFNMFTVEELKAIVEIAHQVHIKIAVHAVYEPEVHAAASAGVDSIEHAYAVTDEDLELMHKNNVYLVPTDWPLEEMIAISALPADATRAERKAEELSDKKAIAARQERLRHAPALGVEIAFGSDWYYEILGHTRGEESLKTS